MAYLHSKFLFLVTRSACKESQRGYSKDTPVPSMSCSSQGTSPLPCLQRQLLQRDSHSIGVLKGEHCKKSSLQLGWDGGISICHALSELWPFFLGESAPETDKKPLSSPPASRQYKKFNFEGSSPFSSTWRCLAAAEGSLCTELASSVTGGCGALGLVWDCSK